MILVPVALKILSGSCLVWFVLVVLSRMLGLQVVGRLALTCVTVALVAVALFVIVPFGPTEDAATRATVLTTFDETAVLVKSVGVVFVGGAAVVAMAYRRARQSPAG
jgi:hypothetical protein